MTQTATVKSVNGDKAVIEVSRKAMCDGCHNSNCGGSCPMSGIFSSGKMMTTTAVNKIAETFPSVISVTLFSVCLKLILQLRHHFLYFSIFALL